MINKTETTTKENDQMITAKSCSYEDIGNILISSGSKAIFIDGVASIILTGYFQRDMLMQINIVTATVAGFVSYATREYSTKCLDDMQYPGGVVGGILKYSIKGSNPMLGAINNLGYEVCKYHKLNSNICVVMLETGEEIVKSLLGMCIAPITNAFFTGVIISSVLIISAEVVYSSLDKYVKTAFNFTADNNVTISENQNATNFQHSTWFSNSTIENDVCLVGDDPGL